MKTKFEINRIVYFTATALTICTQNISGQNIGINATGATPNVSSILDLNTGNNFTSPNGKGLLIPNVALTSVNDIVTISAPPTSLLVYNTASSGAGLTAVVAGYYYFDGVKWVRLQTSAGTGADWSTIGNSGTVPGTNFLGTTDNKDVVFKTNNTEYMRLTSGGMLGVGTNLPLSKMHVQNGSSSIYNNNTWGVFNIYNYGGIGSHPVFMGYKAGGTSLAPTYPTAGQCLNAFAGRDGVDGPTAYPGYGGAVMYIHATENYSSINKGARVTFQTTNNGTNTPVSRLSINHNGNVNIGNSVADNSAILDLNTGNNYTSPNGKGFLAPNVSLTSTSDVVTVNSPVNSLLVYNTSSSGSGTSAVTPGFYFWNGTQWVRLQTSSSTSADWSTTGNTGTTAGTNYIGTTDPIDFVTKTNNIERLRVTSSGSVGVGIAAPSQKLHLIGDFRIDPIATSESSIWFGSDKFIKNAGSTGTSYTYLGYGHMLSKGANSTGIGDNALAACTNIGIENVALGMGAGRQVNNGQFNTLLGTSSADALTTGNGNVTIGWGADLYNSTGSNNVVIGSNLSASGSAGNRSGCVHIGNEAGTMDNTNNTLYIENSNSSTPLIYGDFSADKVKVNGTLGASTLAGTGNRIVTADPSGNLTTAVLSGTYNPVITTGGATTTGHTANGPFMYSRVGDIVTITGTYSCNWTGGGADFTFITLPIPTTFTSAWDLMGTVNVSDNTSSPGFFVKLVRGAGTKMLVAMSNISLSGTVVVQFTCQYQVK